VHGRSVGGGETPGARLARRLDRTAADGHRAPEMAIEWVLVYSIGMGGFYYSAAVLKRGA
jgi:hypothetical protein